MVHTCRACAECCDACLVECEKLNDPEMREVLDSLKKCAAVCREMVKVMGGQATLADVDSSDRPARGLTAARLSQARRRTLPPSVSQANRGNSSENMFI